MDRRQVLIGGLSSLAMATLGWAGARAQSEPAWVKLPTEPYRGKQDDIFFVDRLNGWYGNGLGKLFRTRDGGDNWTLAAERPGTFIRALGFVDENLGLIGNIGTGYFPNVEDETPLYRTTDGGVTWSPVQIEGELKGICAICVQRVPFINAGNLDHRVVLWAGGRVGGPAHLAVSRDLGLTWTAQDLSPLTAMILDVQFVSERVGFIAGATDASVQESRATILRTDDGGQTWTRVYEGGRPWELTWKMSFPSPQVGYVTVQSYNQDPASSARYVAKTTDGGLTWTELPLIDDLRVRQFGVGFMDEQRGWVGAVPHGFETRDGGQTWTPADMGPAVNKVRVVRDDAGTSVFAIGVEVRRLILTA